MLVLGAITDLHFGPEAHHRGKLRKLTGRTPQLTRAFVARMNDEIRPDLVVNLGDDIEDEGPEADRARYRQCLSILREAHAPLVNVAGNHDTVHLHPRDLLDAWRADTRPGSPAPVDDGPELRYAFDRGGFHFTVLHTHEKKSVEITVGQSQLEWLASDLASTQLPTVVLMHHSAAEQQLHGNRWFEACPELALVKERAEFRRVLQASGKVVLVLNGHLHWNHLGVIEGIPYVTLQSLTENLDEDAPGRPAAAHAIVRLSPERVVVEVEGEERARYQFERRP
jgi:3',5'-cyclic AMP phosphodiesterase CpdA